MPVCKDPGVKLHTINFSLVVLVCTERLPGAEVLSITTTCGHHMLALALVKDLAERIRKRRFTPEKAARKLARLCPCGIFNHTRAAKLLAGMAQKEDGKGSPGQRA